MCALSTPPVDAQPAARFREHDDEGNHVADHPPVDAQLPLTAAAIVAPHYPVPGYPEFCHRDGQRWPCDVIRLDAARAGDGLLREAFMAGVDAALTGDAIAAVKAFDAFMALHAEEKDHE